MTNSLPSPGPRGLPVTPPTIGKAPQTSAIPSFPPVQSENGGIPKIPVVNSGKPLPVGGATDSFTDVFSDESDFFADVPRTLIVNEQPFFRWFKRVSLALIITSAFLAGVSWFMKAPLEIGLTAIAAVWVVILAFSLPEALIPFKKTKFDLRENTVRVGQKKPRPISDIKIGLFTTKKRNSKLWLGFDEKDGFFVPLRSNKFSMKKTDLLALRTVIPHTSITQFGNTIDLEGNVNKVEVTQQAITEYIEELITKMS